MLAESPTLTMGTLDSFVSTFADHPWRHSDRRRGNQYLTARRRMPTRAVSGQQAQRGVSHPAIIGARGGRHDPILDLSLR